MPLDRELLTLLACPQCKGTLAPCPAEDGLRCETCAVVYPVDNGIPVMLPDAGIPDAEWEGSRE